MFTMPTIDNLVVLAAVLEVPMDEIIVIDPMNGATRWQLKRLSTYASRLYKNN